MLELYILETCPYSKKVMSYMADAGIEYNKHDVSKGDNLDKLIELGGEGQVPFLLDTDTDKAMYESDDIIEYLKENYA